MKHMTEYIDKTEAMRRFKPFGREIPKEQVMAVLARIDEGIVRCKDCKHRPDSEWLHCSYVTHSTNDNGYCSFGERSE